MAGENGGKENSGRKWRERTAGKKKEDKRNNKIQKNTTNKISTDNLIETKRTCQKIKKTI